jgi:hypothetical protein
MGKFGGKKMGDLEQHRDYSHFVHEKCETQRKMLHPEILSCLLFHTFWDEASPVLCWTYALESWLILVCPAHPI